MRSISISNPTINEPLQNYEQIEQEEDEDVTSISSNESKSDQEIEEEEEERPVWTFRAVLLGSISCIVLFVLNKFFLYQTAECVMSMVSTLAILYPLGYIMAKFLPKRTIYLAKFGLEFSLNPGPFDIREFALVSIFANSGAVYGGITNRFIPHLSP